MSECPPTPSPLNCRHRQAVVRAGEDINTMKISKKSVLIFRSLDAPAGALRGGGSAFIGGMGASAPIFAKENFRKTQFEKNLILKFFKIIPALK